MAAPAKERTSWLGFLWSKKSRKPVEKVRELEKDPPPRPAPKDIPAVGIDLGTSFTAVGYVDSLGVPRIFKNDFDKDTTPSVVHFSFPLKVVVGEAAVQLRKNAATNTITKIKRLIGRKHNSVYLGDQRWTCKVVRDSNGRFGVKMGKELVTPEQISAHILVYMKEIAKKVLKDEPTNAVITVPANFTNAQRQATQNAAKLAGLNVLQIINEPTAAAIAFSAENVHKDKQTVVVFDLGGGTFDVSIVEIDGRQITVLATDGLPCLGGCNFDELIYEEALARYRAMDINILEQVGPDEVDWTLMEKCEIAKKALSSLDAVMISDERYQGAGFLFTYETFVELCQGLFEQTIRLTETVMRGEGIEKNKIDEILLVGGSTRIRWIRETLAQRFPNKRIRFDINPDIVVAQGAAILADSLSKKQSSGDSFVSLFDVTPFDLGLRLGNRCKALIPKNTQIPFATYELCANAKSNERLLTIEILEGNSPQASNNETVVKVDIDIEPMPAGDNNIKVEISIDANGILSVSATDEDTCKQVSVTILSMPNAIGIDLGTTNSCVAYMKSDTVVEVVENHYGNKTTPSIVHFGMFKDVGEAAQAHRARDPQNTVFQVKRLMGRAASDRVLASRRYPFKIVPAESGEVCVGVTVRDNEGREESRTYDPELISSMILRFMMILAQTHIGSKVTDAVITVPANFNNAQRQATKTAGLMAGLNVLRIVNEPTAAALAYGFHLNSEKERVVLVYDLGGGTFDVSIVRAHGMIDDVLATAGETYLGGEDFDHRLYEHAFQEFRNQGIDIVQEEEYGLLNSCEKAKIALSVSDRATIELFKNGRRHSFEITRDKFEELCMDLFEKTILCVTDAMLEAKLTKEMIDDVVLVGGSSRIPKVQQMVREFFDDKELQFNIPPDHAVAYGAAILAESLSANPDQDCNSIRGAVKLSDVLPFSLGTQCAYERFSVMLRRNTKYPCSKTQGYHNAEDNLTALTVLILEGESADAKENAVLGQCHIPVPERNVGENKMLVTYSVDADGILSVHLRDEDTTEEASTRVETSRFTEEQRMAVVRNARLEEEDDKIQRARHLARTSFANAMDSVRRSVHATKSTEKKEKLRKLIENEDSWFKTQESPSNEDFIARASSIKGKLAAIMNS